MSYILEALKKSQQERELGRVPTLDANLYPAPEAAVRTSPWSLAAVGLAMLAVIIALYAALRSDPLAPGTEPDAGGPAKQTVGETPSASPPAMAASGSGAETDVPTDGAETRDPGTAEAEQAVEPLAAPPPPRRAPPPEPRNLVDERIPPRPAGPAIPEDVRADIEAFKQEVGGGRPPPVRPAAAVPPEQLRLPPEVEARAPAFLMTVHVYDEDPSKRFVLINALKTKEGERTREGLVLEEILPNGAVLSFQGHKFFRHR